MCSVFKFQRSAIGRLFQARNPLVFLVCVRLCLFFEGGERASQPIQNSLLDRALSLPPAVQEKEKCRLVMSLSLTRQAPVNSTRNRASGKRMG